MPMATKNSSLLFLTDCLQNPCYYKQMNLPLEFIAFGITEGKMYRYRFGNFVIPLDEVIAYGNTVVYGGLFYCPDITFYLRILDGHYLCSKSIMHKNHALDLRHRRIAPVTPIYFNDLDELIMLRYKEGGPVDAHVYYGNTKREVVHNRIGRRENHGRNYRVIDGIEAEHFLSLYKEVNE